MKEFLEKLLFLLLEKKKTESIWRRKFGALMGVKLAILEKFIQFSREFTGIIGEVF